MPVAGVISDEIGRARTLLIMMGLQSAIILPLLFIGESEAMLLVAEATLVGFNSLMTKAP